MLRETDARPTAGIPVALMLVAVAFGGVFLLIAGARSHSPATAIAGLVVTVLALFTLPGLFMVAPNEGKALTLFGNYKGTVRTPGLWFTNPFMAKKGISLRVRNFETAKLKVNDARSNPVEIGAIVV